MGLEYSRSKVVPAGIPSGKAACEAGITRMLGKKAALVVAAMSVPDVDENGLDVVVV